MSRLGTVLTAVSARERQRSTFNRFDPGVFRISAMRGWILSLDKTISPGTNFLAVSEFTSELLDERPNRGNEPPISYLFWAIDPLGTRSPAE